MHMANECLRIPPAVNFPELMRRAAMFRIGPPESGLPENRMWFCVPKNITTNLNDHAE